MGDVAGCRRVARPAQRRYVPSRKERADAWSCLLSKIDSSYTEARDRLAVRARPVMLSRFLDRSLLKASYCYGPLDPDKSGTGTYPVQSLIWCKRAINPSGTHDLDPTLSAYFVF